MNEVDERRNAGLRRRLRVRGCGGGAIRLVLSSWKLNSRA